jgi:non-heme chloroperoxidase
VWREVMTQMLSPEADVQLTKIKAPTLIIWGDKENLFPRSEQDALLAVLKNSVLKVYPDTGHAPNWEQPERFAKDLQEFLN